MHPILHAAAGGLLSGNPSAITFLVIGGVATVLLVIALFIDGIFDVLDFGDGPVSLTSIAAFFALFGWIGFAADSFGAGLGLSIATGVVAGLIGGACGVFLARFLHNSTSSATFSSNELVAAEATVVRPIFANEGYGEIALSRNGQRVTFAARAAQDIAVGVRVRITDNLSPTSVLVEPIVDSTH